MSRSYIKTKIINVNNLCVPKRFVKPILKCRIRPHPCHLGRPAHPRDRHCLKCLCFHAVPVPPVRSPELHHHHHHRSLQMTLHCWGHFSALHTSSLSFCGQHSLESILHPEEQKLRDETGAWIQAAAFATNLTPGKPRLPHF